MTLTDRAEADQAVAVGHRAGLVRWRAETDRLLDRMAGRFARVETRRRTRGFLLGLLADLPRKNCWTIAEHAGDRDPHGMQNLRGRASWDTDGVGDDLRDYVTAGLGDTDEGPAATGRSAVRAMGRVQHRARRPGSACLAAWTTRRDSPDDVA